MSAATTQAGQVARAILAKHPGPWRYVSVPVPPGTVEVYDAANHRVELFTMLDLCVAFTTLSAPQPKATPEPSQPAAAGAQQ